MAHKNFNQVTEPQLLGSYLIEADLISSNQLNQALIEQKNNADLRLGEILVNRGWIKQKTIEYFVEKIIDSDRINSPTNFPPGRNELESNNKFYNSTLNKSEENELIMHSAKQERYLSLPTFKISPKRVSRLLLVAIAFLIIASLLAQFAAYFVSQFTSINYTGKLFVLDEEANIPTVYSALTLAFCSMLLAIISYIKKGVNSRYSGYWKSLSLIFFFICLDEACSIHEIFINPLRKLFNASGFFYFAWVIPAFIFLVIFLLGFLRFIKALPQTTRSLFIKAGTLYVGGALGMELISGYFADIYPQNTIAYTVLTTIEESLEMLGIVVFIYALLSYIKLHIEEMKLSIRFDNSKYE